MEQLIVYVLGVVCTVMGWMLREVWGAVKAMRQDHDQFRVHVAENYVHSNRMEKALEPVMRKLDRIEDALANKADK